MDMEDLVDEFLMFYLAGKQSSIVFSESIQLFINFVLF